MQFSTILIALMAAAPFIAASPTPEEPVVKGLESRDLHTRLICYTYRKSIKLGESTANTEDAATIAACNAYRRRNTGNKKWDKCPDCTVIQLNEIKACQSKNGHLGGDEFNYYCKKNGANTSG
ncbi:hypothetical protein HYFRA_00000660 [Hymenoscyphus fraxineus]|uniref:Uncharacterized protein n=1 Tax=Hymenoscyphus fraxineus TaxID=746836 RepID=A0A9N9L5V8_9HELO|nr:hypothetical protein HYFRA_00000660 [Hymenoscyphus fraxineus]